MPRESGLPGFCANYVETGAHNAPKGFSSKRRLCAACCHCDVAISHKKPSLRGRPVARGNLPEKPSPGGREHDRRRWREEGRCSGCRGRCITQAHRRQDAHRAPQTEWWHGEVVTDEGWRAVHPCKNMRHCTPVTDVTDVTISPKPSPGGKVAERSEVG